MNWDIATSNEEETQFVEDKLVAFNKNHVPFTQKRDFENLNFNIKDKNEFVIAGINSVVYCWKVLYIGILFVAESYRGQQLGSLLLNKVEDQAKTMEASLSHLDTFDWQAKDFYLKAGYEVFGVLDACPPGHKRYYMKKILSIIFTIFLGLNVSAFAKDISTINGSSRLNKVEYDSLEVNGDLTFGDLSIKDSLVVNGSIQGKTLKCKIFKANGSVDVDGFQAQDVKSSGLFSGENITVTGDAEFDGGLEIENGKLHDMQIASARSTIVDTQVNGNIRIKKVNKGWSFFGFKSNEPSAQILELKGNSFVNGDIFFEENGEVHIFDGAKVKGKIVNAKVIGLVCT